MPDKKRICLIEDDEGLAEAWTLLLEDEGYDVARLADGSGIRSVMRKRKPDMFILDYLLPGPDGLAIAGELRSRRETAYVPIILVSAAQIPDMRKVYAAGVNGYFIKPVSTGEFLRTISFLTGRRRAHARGRNVSP